MTPEEARSLLGVGSNATTDEIKQAVRKLSLRYHPDRHVGAADALLRLAQREFSRAHEAGELLTNLSASDRGQARSDEAEGVSKDASEQCETGMYWAFSAEPPNWEQAAIWFRLAADQGHARAQSNLGTCYLRGLGVRQDRASAVSLYRQSAEQGWPAGQFNLGLCFQDGIDVKQDSAEAAKWFRLAASQEHPDAQLRLGLCYIAGVGVVQDHTQASFWFHKAAEQGLPEAQGRLGVCYASGNGVQQDLGQARYWLEKAHAGGWESAEQLLEELRQGEIGQQRWTQPRDPAQPNRPSGIGPWSDWEGIIDPQHIHRARLVHMEAESAEAASDADALLRCRGELIGMIRRASPEEVALQRLQARANEGNEVDRRALEAFHSMDGRGGLITRFLDSLLPSGEVNRQLRKQRQQRKWLRRFTPKVTDDNAAEVPIEQQTSVGLGCATVTWIIVSTTTVLVLTLALDWDWLIAVVAGVAGGAVIALFIRYAISLEED